MYKRQVVFYHALTPFRRFLLYQIFGCLSTLFKLYHSIVTNDALCLAAWGEDYYGHENSLMVHIRHLREKIENEPSSPQHIVTVKGLGYKLVTNDE